MAAYRATSGSRDAKPANGRHENRATEVVHHGDAFLPLRSFSLVATEVVHRHNPVGRTRTLVTTRRTRTLVTTRRTRTPVTTRRSQTWARRTRTPVAAALASAGILLLSACGGSHVSPLQRKLARARTTHEFPAPPPPAERVSSASRGAIAAIEAFVHAYINWSAKSVSSDMRSLARRSVGQARSALTLAAAQTANDYELQRGGIANSGTVEAVVPYAGHRNQYVVVTLESTTASNTTAYQGLRPAWHVAIATVREVGRDEWALSGWQPES
jgi:hypothetical protein